MEDFDPLAKNPHGHSHIASQESRPGTSLAQTQTLPGAFTPANSHMHTPTSPEASLKDSRPQDNSSGQSSNASRRSSITSRRSSFLSRSMLKSDIISVYESYSFAHSGLTPYSIISLKESQGFLFNQDLFATPYQQSRAWERERRNKALMSSKKRSKSHGNVLGHSSPVFAKQRRHTSYDDPPFRVTADRSRGLDNAIEEGSNDDMSIDDSSSCNQEPSLSFEARMAESLSNCNNDSEGYSSESEDETMEYSAIGSNHVPVVDIVVDANGPLIPDEYLIALEKSR